MLGRDLPEDVLMEILSRLPVKTLMRFKCISKSWYALITNPYFITKHLTSHNSHTGAIFAIAGLRNPPRLCWLSNETLEQSGDEVHTTQLFQHALRDVDIFGPCNGILCLAGTLKVKNGDLKPDFEIVLWNPATRESKMLPPMDLPTSYFKSNFGFGYDSKTNDYKVVILSFDSHCEVVVYSLSSNSWRKIDSTPNPSYLIRFPVHPGYLNGVHHWSAGGGTWGFLEFFSTVRPFLLSFDMSNEVFQEVLGPLTGACFTMQVTIVNDSVTLILKCTVDLKEYWYEIWVLNDFGVKRPWTKISTIRVPPDLWDLHLIKLREDGSLAFLHGDRDHDGDLVLYDPRTQELRHLQLDEGLYDRIISYTESLVFLNGARKQDNS